MIEEAFQKLLTNYEETMEKVRIVKKYMIYIRRDSGSDPDIYILKSKENPGLSGLGRPGSEKIIKYCKVGKAHLSEEQPRRKESSRTILKKLFVSRFH